ncbi:MAG: hypothetical protein KBT79_16075, partial [Thalassolituus oleivorans]|nr:hypothetical protein [Thalassolituus oleivorans]
FCGKSKKSYLVDQKICIYILASTSNLSTMASSLGGVICRYLIRGVCINIIEPHAHGVDVL